MPFIPKPSCENHKNKNEYILMRIICRCGFAWKLFTQNEVPGKGYWAKLWRHRADKWITITTSWDAWHPQGLSFSLWRNDLTFQRRQTQGTSSGDQTRSSRLLASIRQVLILSFQIDVYLSLSGDLGYLNGSCLWVYYLDACFVLEMKGRNLVILVSIISKASLLLQIHTQTFVHMHA